MNIQPNPIYLMNPVRTTPEISETVANYLSSWLEKHNAKNIQYLYHYTTLHGLKGILENRSFWFGHASTFNDPLEIEHGKTIIISILNKYAVENDDRNIKAFFQSLSTNIEAFGTILYHIFVLCFCESGDLLSQWRSYADHGGGYSLGLNFSDKCKASCNIKKGENNRPLFLRKVIYNETEQRGIVEEYLNSVVEGLHNRLRNNPIKDSISFDSSIMAMEAVNPLFDMLLCFKHESFSEEKEWRLVQVIREGHQPETIQFREDNKGLIPYRNTHILNENEDGTFEFPLESINFGPSLEPIRTRSAIGLLLHHLSANKHPIGLRTTINIKGVGYRLRDK